MGVPQQMQIKFRGRQLDYLKHLYSRSRLFVCFFICGLTVIFLHERLVKIEQLVHSKLTEPNIHNDKTMFNLYSNHPTYRDFVWKWPCGLCIHLAAAKGVEARAALCARDPAAT